MSETSRSRARTVAALAAAGLTALATPLLTGCTSATDSVESEVKEGRFVSGIATEGEASTTKKAAAAQEEELLATFERDGEPIEVDAAAKTTRPMEPGRLAVAGMHASSHEGYDRVVIQLDGEGEPGWFVDYVSSPVQAAGHPIDVAGEHFLTVNIDHTVSPFEMGLGHTDERVAGSGNIVEIVSGGTSDGRSQLVIGLQSHAPFTVETVRADENDDAAPMQIIIDIAQD